MWRKPQQYCSYQICPPVIPSQSSTRACSAWGFVSIFLFELVINSAPSGGTNLSDVQRSEQGSFHERGRQIVQGAQLQPQTEYDTSHRLVQNSQEYLGRSYHNCEFSRIAGKQLSTWLALCCSSACKRLSEETATPSEQKFGNEEEEELYGVFWICWKLVSPL